MLEHGQITHTDGFSYTMAGSKWVNVKWLYEIIIATLEKIGGVETVILLQALVNVVILWLLFKCIKLVSRYAAQEISIFYYVITAILFLATVEYRMASRPEMMSHLLCAVFVLFILNNPTPKWKNILWLVPLQCFWANMHEGYPVGLVIITVWGVAHAAYYIITKEKQQLQYTTRVFVLLMAALLAILINPNGLQLWKQPFEIYRQVWANKYTTELYSCYQSQYWTIQAKLHVGLLLAVSLFWVVFITRQLKQKKLSEIVTPNILAYLLLIPLFGYLSLSANRNIPFAQIVLFASIPIMLRTFITMLHLNSTKLYHFISRRAMTISIILPAVFYVLVVNNTFYKFTNSPNRYGACINVMHNPVGAANFIKEHNIKGTAFSDYFVSSYLLWALYPDYKSYIDLRDLDVFPASFFDTYFSLYTHPQKFYALDTQYHFNYAVITTSQLTGIMQQLYWKEGYNLIYVDPVAAIFLKQNEQNKPLNDNLQIQKLFSWVNAPQVPTWAMTLNKLLNPFANYDEEEETQAPLFGALFYQSVRNYPLAIKLLLPQLSAMQDDTRGYVALSNIYAAYAKETPSPELKQKRIDSAGYFGGMVKSP